MTGINWTLGDVTGEPGRKFRAHLEHGITSFRFQRYNGHIVHFRLCKRGNGRYWYCWRMSEREPGKRVELYVAPFKRLDGLRIVSKASECDLAAIYGKAVVIHAKN